MELLIIKSGEDYIRIKDGAYLRVGMDKASVFPPAHLNTVREHATHLREIDWENVRIKKLVITELPLAETGETAQ